MPGDALKHVKRGDPPGIDVNAWNALVDGVRPHSDAPDPEDFEPRDLIDHDLGAILVRNDSGADRNRFDILGLASPLISHTANSVALQECLRRVALSGITPASSHERNFCVLQEPIPSGKTGLAKISGYTFVYTNGASSTIKQAKC